MDRKTKALARLAEQSPVPGERNAAANALERIAAKSQGLAPTPGVQVSGQRMARTQAPPVGEPGGRIVRRWHRVVDHGAPPQREEHYGDTRQREREAERLREAEQQRRLEAAERQRQASRWVPRSYWRKDEEEYARRKQEIARKAAEAKTEEERQAREYDLRMLPARMKAMREFPALRAKFDALQERWHNVMREVDMAHHYGGPGCQRVAELTPIYNTLEREMERVCWDLWCMCTVLGPHVPEPREEARTASLWYGRDPHPKFHGMYYCQIIEERCASLALSLPPEKAPIALGAGSGDHAALVEARDTMETQE